MAKSLPGPIRLGVSACLVGERVRYNGDHKLDSYVAGTLARHFRLVPVCPEVGIGLGVPREPIRLEGDPGRPLAVGLETPGLEVSRALETFGRRTARTIGPISGFILKSRSPSCGREGVTVHGHAAPTEGQGIFARELHVALPLLPMEEERHLGEPEGRENFLERVFAYRRWQELEARGLTAARLLQFHAGHKLILMAHSPKHYQILGRHMARVGRRGLRSFATEYARGFMEALAVKATRAGHANVLHHLGGYLKKALDAEARAELLESVETFRAGRAPLIVPLTLLQHHFRRHPNAYVARQLYLHPTPDELNARFS